ncbi:MAG: ORF6N domain-containing protein [Ruminococcus sp.]|nr:ORF6N domain-containing protein [Ruminococcus sp.]
MIYEINGIQVMLDSELAKLYQCKNGTKEINQAVKNNPLKFPDRFSWVLNDTEIEELRSKNLTTNYSKMSRSNPRVFTEQGVMMLATILKSEVAVEVSISIMDAFVKLRRYISSSLINSEVILNHENRILKLETTFNRMKEKEKINTIFFEGQIFDAYTLLLDILETAKEEIIIIDNYANKELLKILKNVDKKVIIISKNMDNVLIKKYNSEYSNIEFKNIDIFHDRFIIIDRKKLYSCGASFKDLGHKCFAINEMESKGLINNLLSKIFK